MIMKITPTDARIAAMLPNAAAKPRAEPRSNSEPVSPASKPPNPSDRNHSPVASATWDAGANRAAAPRPIGRDQPQRRYRRTPGAIGARRCDRKRTATGDQAGRELGDRVRFRAAPPQPQPQDGEQRSQHHNVRGIQRLEPGRWNCQAAERTIGESLGE